MLPGDVKGINKFFCFSSIFLFSVFIFCFYSQHRFVAGDEAFYIMAGKLVFSDKLLYTDFFYPQMPYLAYFLGFFGSLTDFTWESSRLSAVLFSSGIALLIAEQVYQKSKKYLLAIISVMIFLLCDFVFEFFPIVKTYSYSVFFLLLAARFILKNSKYSALLAGLFFGISVGIRLQFAIAMLPILLFCWRKPNRNKTIPFLLGTSIGLLPVLITAINDFEAFWFNNIGYHQLRNRVGLIGGFHQKISSLRNLVGYADQVGYVSWQFLVIFIAALIENLLRVFQKREFTLYFTIALSLFLVSLLPTPVYLQYFCVLVPFLVIDTTCLILRVLEDKNILLKFFTLACLLGYLCPFPQEFQRYTVTGKGVPGVYNRKNAQNWKVDNLEEIAKVIDVNLPEDHLVLSTWPGYLLGSKAKPVEGTEN
ncbi:MAG: hypothetical protein KDD56_08710, partial [Bdellovibrionales bacterium]|nr:hypothetical protein [Bdellovibrionales bacterium]